MTNKEALQELLQELIRNIYSIIKDGLEKGTLQPQLEPYFRWKLTEFEYGDKGITKKSARGKHYSKPYWGRVADKVCQQVSKLNVYTDILSLVSSDYQIKGFQSNYFLPTFTTRVTTSILEGKITDLRDAEKYIDFLIADLKGERQEYRAEVQLKGIVIELRSIKLDSDTRLRRPIRNDFERGEPVSIPHFVRRMEDPTAFLYTKIFVKADNQLDLSPPMELQNRIDGHVAVLRLFRVGAVQDIQIANSTDSIIHMAGGTQTRSRLLGSDKYLIARQDTKQLKKYWSNMKRVELPASIYAGNQKEPDELSIAYDRYSDSLEAGVIEKRISSAVMGLESLYLGGGEQQEMSYRLSMRAGKLLSLIGYDAKEVSERIKDAYEIRSKYVHGGILKQKDRQKIERKHGNISEFPVTITDYLRASIVALLRRHSKTSIIRKIDDCFLDSNKEEEIRELLFMPYEKEVS